MTFRRRLIALSAAAVATAVVLGSVVTYVIVRADLRSGVDHQLRQLVAAGLNVSSAPSGGNESSSMNSLLSHVVLDRRNRAKLTLCWGLACLATSGSAWRQARHRGAPSRRWPFPATLCSSHWSTRSSSALAAG